MKSLKLNRTLYCVDKKLKKIVIYLSLSFFTSSLYSSFYLTNVCLGEIYDRKENLSNNEFKNKDEKC